MRKILLMSDDVTLITQLQQLPGYSFYIARDDDELRQMLQYLASELDYVRLILLDITADVDDVYAIFEYLLAFEVNIAVITADAEDAVEYIRYGAVDYIVKPSPVELLRTRIESALRFTPTRFVDFMRFVSHELKNPLMPVKGYSSALATGMAGELNEEQTEFAEIVFENAVRLDQMINGFREMAMLDAGTLEIHLEETALTDVLSPVLMQFEAAIASKHQTLTLKMPDNLPFLFSHRGYLARVLTILLHNAHTYTPVGGAICLSVTERPHNLIEIVVQDTGFGIPNDEQPHILSSRYFRSRDPRVRDLPGNGISLYIARHLTDALDGNLWFESTPELGTAFYVRVPVVG